MLANARRPLETCHLQETHIVCVVSLRRVDLSVETGEELARQAMGPSQERGAALPVPHEDEP